MKTITGNISATDLRVAILQSRNNMMLSDQLLKGATDSFVRHGGNDNDLTLITVPSFNDFSIVIKQIKDVDVIVCLGAEYSTTDLSWLKVVYDTAANNKIPVSFGFAIESCLEDLVNSCGVKAGNKGEMAMENAIELANVLKQI